MRRGAARHSTAPPVGPVNRRRLTAALGVAAAFAASACAGSAGTPGEPRPTDVVLYVPEGEGGFDAQLRGELGRVGQCVVVRSVEAGVDYAPALPVGTRWDGDALVVHGQRLRIGDEVAWSGGEYGGDPAELEQVPADCAGLAVFVVNR